MGRGSVCWSLLTTHPPSQFIKLLNLFVLSFGTLSSKKVSSRNQLKVNLVLWMSPFCSYFSRTLQFMPVWSLQMVPLCQVPWYDMWDKVNFSYLWNHFSRIFKEQWHSIREYVVYFKIRSRNVPWIISSRENIKSSISFILGGALIKQRTNFIRYIYPKNRPYEHLQN